jgi:hypothetical protein
MEQQPAFDTSFFEALGVADQERIHTQFLAWILDPDTSPLKAIDRSELVRALLSEPDGASEIESRVPRLVLTELKHIDLVILLDRDIVFLENKLKSKQGKNQLSRYNEAITSIWQETSEAGLWEGDRTVRKVFLTFSGETNANGWKDLDYSPLFAALNRVDTTNPFVCSYRAFLGKLLELRHEYLNNHTGHPHVDDYAGLRGIDRLQLTRRPDLSTLEIFLIKHRLGTLFVQALMHRLATMVGQWRHGVGETRGHALMETTFFECTLTDAPRDVRFRVGTQLQRGTLKLNIGAGDHYGDSDRDWIRKIEPSFDAAMKRHWPSTFPKFGAHGRNRAYRSWSFRMTAGEQWSEVPLQPFADRYHHLLRLAHETWSTVLQELCATGSVSSVTPVAPGVLIGQDVLDE